MRLNRLVFMDEKKLSIAALSQHSPRQLMLQVMPCALSNCWKSSLVYWVDSTGRRNTFNQEVLMGRTAGWM